MEMGTYVHTETCDQERARSLTAHHTSAVERKLKCSPAETHEPSADVCVSEQHCEKLTKC